MIRLTCLKILAPKILASIKAKKCLQQHMLLGHAYAYVKYVTPDVCFVNNTCNVEKEYTITSLGLPQFFFLEVN